MLWQRVPGYAECTIYCLQGPVVHLYLALSTMPLSLLSFQRFWCAPVIYAIPVPLSGFFWQVVVGGKLGLPGHPGQFYPPTVLTSVSPDMDIWREEVFGPVSWPLSSQRHSLFP
jgi:hypothetical protein